MNSARWTRATRPVEPRWFSFTHEGRLQISVPDSSPQFRAVPRDEMAFALNLFVEAANQRVPAQSQTQEPEDDSDGCLELYDILCIDPVNRAVPERSHASHETSLYTAFSALCSFYGNDPLQAAICARVLAFYFLMERSAGAALKEWIQQKAEAPGLVTLHPAVVDAIATVKLNGSTALSAGALLQRIAALAAKPEQTH